MIYLTDTQLLLIAGICAAGILLVLVGALLTGRGDHEPEPPGDGPNKSWERAQEESYRRSNR